MRSTNLHLTLTGERFSVTPLPAHVDSRCTFETSCLNQATHRLVSRDINTAERLCDPHVIAWARDHGVNITLTTPGDSAA